MNENNEKQPLDSDKPPPYNVAYSGYAPPNQNANQSAHPPGQYPPAQYPPGQYPQGQYPPSQYPPNQFAPNQYPPNQYPPNQYPPNQYPHQNMYPVQGQVSVQAYPPGSVVVVQGPQSNVPDYLVFNIIATIFCCWIIGIFAIVKSLGVQSMNRQGRTEEARQLSQRARRLGYWTVGVGAALISFCILISIVLPLITVSASLSSEYSH